MKRVIFFLDRLSFDYHVNKNGDKVTISSRDSAVDTVSLNLFNNGDSETAWRLLLYKSITITLEEKTDTMRYLYMKLEEIKKDNNISDVKFHDTKRLVNYFRDYKENKFKVQEIESDPEFYCDLAFDLSIEILLDDYNNKIYKKNIEIIKKIK